MALNPPYQSTIKSLLSQPSLTGTRTMKTWRGTGKRKRILVLARRSAYSTASRAAAQNTVTRGFARAWRKSRASPQVCLPGVAARLAPAAARSFIPRGRLGLGGFPGPCIRVLQVQWSAQCTSRPMPPSVPSSPLSLSCRPSPEPRGDSAPAGQARRRDARSPRPRAPRRAAAGRGRGLRVGCAGERRPSGHHAPAVVLG